MPTGLHFKIRYLMRGESRAFLQADSKMTDADAWYYACLHAGIGVLPNISPPCDEITALMQHARKSGMTNVQWEQLA
jgi:hypothetical protein